MKRNQPRSTQSSKQKSRTINVKLITEKSVTTETDVKAWTTETSINTKLKILKETNNYTKQKKTQNTRAKTEKKSSKSNEN